MAEFPPAGGYPLDSPDRPYLGNSALFLADAIDPLTGDYRSIQRGVDPVEAAALEALMVRRGSGSAVQDDGHKLHEIKRVDGRTEFLVRSEIEYAWRRLVESGQIRLDGLTAKAEGDTVHARVAFTNLVAGRTGSLSLPLLALQPPGAT